MACKLDNKGITHIVGILIVALVIITGTISLIPINKNNIPTILAFAEEQPKGTTYYVSKKGSNENGLTWNSAWNELSKINWGIIKPGDTVLIDGGMNEMVYRTQLTPIVSGTDFNPITIKLSTEKLRNGKAIIFGGRNTKLPYCGQKDYNFQTEGVLRYGIYLENVSNIVFDGSKWSGITIHGTNGRGIRYRGTTKNITLRYLELFDNGRADLDGSVWNPDSKAIEINGQNHLFERVLIHDNGQDAVQSPGQNLKNLTIRESHLYNSRKHPNVNQSFNYCAHSDGLQIFNGGTVNNILIENSIIGPGFTNGLLIGGIKVNVNNVTLKNILILKSNDNQVSAHSSATTAVNNWKLENVTIYSPNTVGSSGNGGNSIYYKGSNISIKDSVVYGSKIYIPNTSPNVSGNCQWNTRGSTIGVTEDPKFKDAIADAFSDGDYSVGNNNCKGSNITSVAMLLNTFSPEILESKEMKEKTEAINIIDNIIEEPINDEATNIIKIEPPKKLSFIELITLYWKSFAVTIKAIF